MLKKVELYTLVLLIIYTFYCAIAVGSSWDEPYEMMIGKNRLKYLFSLGSFKDFQLYRLEEYYPGFYNTIAIFITKIFPAKYEIEIWHLTNTIFSIFAVVGIYKITSNLFNKKVGKIVFLLCFINPIFFGHMAINSKDTIVAFSHVWATYFILRYLQKQDSKYKIDRYIILAGLTIGLGTGVRLPFLFTLSPLMLFIIVDMFFFKTIAIQKFSTKKFLIDGLKVLVIAYFVAIFAWPDTHSNIFTEPFKLFIAQTKLQGFGVEWILFNGDFFNTLSVPKTYIIINLIYKSPEFLFVSYLIFIFLPIINNDFFSFKFNFFWSKILLVVFIISFPIVVLALIPYRIYDGLRLFLYLIPYFCIIPGLGIYYLIKNLSSLFPKILFGLTFSLFVYYLFIFFSFTPYQYTYLNKFIGNLAYADQKFENDYWAVSIEELIAKIPKLTNLTSDNKKIKIAFCGVPHNIGKRELNKLKNLKYEQTDLYNKDVDYIIMTNRTVEKSSDIARNDMKTCFKKFEGEDVISIRRKGLMLSTIRKKVKN
jgi:hypothetical protein|tara:strand:+ start:285 stop:1892 length:1608 start_codon:yes stop_codon:yes gene_type:complete